MKIYNATINNDGAIKVCEICGKKLDRVYYDKIDNKEKCKECYYKK